jgi:hypothetical protein
MQTSGWDSATHRRGVAPLHRLHEDDHLVELEHAQQLKQLPVLLGVNLHEGELPRVAHDRDGDLAVHRLDLLQGGQHEYGSPYRAPPAMAT